MKITIKALERSLPTSVSYRSDRIASLEIEAEAIDVAAIQRFVVSQLPAIRLAQFADLDAQEAHLRSKWDMPVPRPPQAEPRPAPPAPAAAPDQVVPVQAPSGPSPPRPAYPAVESLRPAQRVCSNQAAHKASEPRFIESAVYQYSVERFQKPLCRQCQAQAQPVRQT